MTGRISRFVIAGAWLAATGPQSGATWQDDIGYTQLAAELGVALPTGSGISVTHVEGGVADTGEYRPSDSPSPASGNFAGKSFVFRSGPPEAVSGHAVRAGSFIYGLNTDASAGDASVAPHAGSSPNARVLSFKASDWIASGLLRFKPGDPDNALLPRLESSPVSNHSWISSIDNDLSASQANEVLRRLDYSVRVSDYTAVVGVNNGAGTPVPPVLGSGYNVLSVGLTNGNHSTGVTSGDVDGEGRSKPELVAPLTATSWATAVVSSCTAVLQQQAAALTPASVATDAQHSLVIRAVLLAGASKRPFTTPEGVLTWTRTNTRPLDPHFGTGEVNLRRSHQILGGGRFTSGGSQVAGSTGWHYEPALPPGGERIYFFVVPVGSVAREVSVALVWNRHINLPSSGDWNAPTPSLTNLDLRLHDSAGLAPGAERAVSLSGADGSVSHPLEHLFVRELPEGQYALRVSSAGPEPTDFGLAWLSVIEPAQPPALSAMFSPDRSMLSLTLSQLGVGMTYQLQSSEDLVNWTTIQTVDASGPSRTVVTRADGGRRFFRLLPVPQAAARPVG